MSENHSLSPPAEPQSGDEVTRNSDRNSVTPSPEPQSGEARDPEAAAIAACRARIADIDETLVHLNARRDQLLAERDSLGLTIAAAEDPTALNRGSGR